MRRIIMVKKTVTVELASGLEARPVAMLVQDVYKRQEIQRRVIVPGFDHADRLPCDANPFP